MTYSVSVENIKCGGCANTIKTKLEKLDSVETVAVEVEQGMVNIDGDTAQRDSVITLLLKLGYPETGTTEGIAAAKAKAKSFVSCAVGRMNN